MQRQLQQLSDLYRAEADKKALQLQAGEPLEAEPPDFILQGDDGTLGIELTAFHLPTLDGQRPYQERQSLKDRIVQLAERIHHDAGGPALYVMVHFNDHMELDKKDIQPLANAIAASVLNRPVRRPGTACRPKSCQDGRDASTTVRPVRA